MILRVHSIFIFTQADDKIGTATYEQMMLAHCLISSVHKSMNVSMLSELLTWAAEALFPQSNEHIETQVTVGRLVEVLQSPHMLPVIFNILQGDTKRPPASFYIVVRQSASDHISEWFVI